MRSLIIFSFAALVACAHAKLHYRPRPPGYVVGHTDAAFYYPRPHHRDRHARDTPWEHNAGRGKVFGSQGSTDDSIKLTGDGVWNLDHNTRFVAGGNLEKQFGHHRPGVGIQGAIEHGFPVE